MNKRVKLDMCKRHLEMKLSEGQLQQANLWEIIWKFITAHVQDSDWYLCDTYSKKLIYKKINDT